MPLTRPNFIDKAWPNGIDLRRNLHGIVPREGVFPDAVSVGQGLAYAGSGWNVGCRPGVFSVKRGTTDLSYGTALGANHSIDATAWLLPGAPASGTRASILWVELVDPTQGGALTTPSGETVPRAVPRFGITTATATNGTDPTNVPAGVLRIARAVTASTHTSAAQVTITPLYAFAALAGGPITVRTIAERDALVVPDGTECVVLATEAVYRRQGSRWDHLAGRPVAIPITYAGVFKVDASIPAGAYEQDGRVSLEGVVTTVAVPGGVAAQSYQFGSVPVAHAPAKESTWLVRWGDTGLAQVTAMTNGTLWVRFFSAPGVVQADVLRIRIDGCSWRIGALGLT